MKIAGILTNAFALVGGLVVAAMFGFLAAALLGSHVDSDQGAAPWVIALALVSVAGPIVGLILSTRTRSGLRVTGLVIGIFWLLAMIGGVAVVPGVLGAAALP